MGAGGGHEAGKKMVRGKPRVGVEGGSSVWLKSGYIIYVNKIINEKNILLMKRKTIS